MLKGLREREASFLIMLYACSPVSTQILNQIWKSPSGKKDLSCIVYKGHMKAHSKYADKVTQKIEEDEEDD